MIAAIRLKLGSLVRNGVVRSVGVLVGGTAFSQALALMALPLLTRLYTPSDFSVLAVYSSLLGIIGAVVCMRFEFAIPIPERDEEAASLLVLALVSATVIASAIGIAVLAFGSKLVVLLQRPDFEPYLWLLPVGVWVSGIYAALQYWSTRKKRFPVIARTRITQSVGAIGVQMGYGLVAAGPFGLLFGQIVNSGAGSIGLARAALRDDRHILLSNSIRRMVVACRKYQKFPKCWTIEALVNAGGSQLPIVVIAALVAGPDVGLLLLAARVMTAPMGLIGGAVAQVYLSKATEEKLAGRLDSFTANVIGGLIKTGVGPLVFVGAVAPLVFPIAFGQQWARAGAFVTYMTPWFVMQFVTAPVSMAFFVLERPNAALTLHLFGLMLRVGAVFFAVLVLETAVVETYAAAGFIFYFVFFLVVVKVVGLRLRTVFIDCTSALGHLAFWIVAAVLAMMALTMLPADFFRG